MLELTDSGLYCALGDFFIDPWRPVNKALITHAHSDHARFGHKYYLAHPKSEHILRHRLGSEISLQTLEYNQALKINGVKVSFHPAGHIPGSAQIRLENNGEIWVVSGDYKLEKDGLSEPFEPVQCHTFITECTFGLPIFSWEPQETVFQKINQWWASNQEKGLNSVIFAYALGKAQRIIENVDHSIGKVWVHGAVHKSNLALEQSGITLKPSYPITRDQQKTDFSGALIIAPPSAANSPWMKKFTPYRTAIASGWMALRGVRRRKAADTGFILSDHADWKGLNQAITMSNAEKIMVTHGYTAVFAKWLNDNGKDCRELSTLFTGELSEINAEESPEYVQE